MDQSARTVAVALTATIMIHGTNALARSCPAPGFAAADVGGDVVVSVQASYATGNAAYAAAIGDTDGNGVVGFIDLNRILSKWGPCP